MREVVLDASVVLNWFGNESESVDAARSLRAAFEAGELIVLAPSLLFLEIISVAGSCWRWQEAALGDLAVSLKALDFEQVEPDISRVARWTAQGLSAYDAAYVVIAEAARIELVTDDETILTVAPGIATPLAQEITGR